MIARLLRRAKMNKLYIDELMKINDDVNNTKMILNIATKNESLTQCIEDKCELSCEILKNDVMNSMVFQSLLTNLSFNNVKTTTLLIISNMVICQIR